MTRKRRDPRAKAPKPPLLCETCGVRCRQRNVGNPAPFCDDHTTDGPHAQWVRKQEVELEEERLRLAAGGEVDLAHSFVRKLLAFLAEDSPLLRAAANRLGLEEGLVERVAQAAGIRPETSPGRNGSRTLPAVDQARTLEVLLKLVEETEFESPLTLTPPGARSESYAEWQLLRTPPAARFSGTRADRAWEGAPLEEARAIGAKWLCPSCGPVAGKPLHGDDNCMHCPELDCDDVVSSVLPEGSDLADPGWIRQADAVPGWQERFKQHNPPQQAAPKEAAMPEREEGILTTKELAEHLGCCTSLIGIWVKNRGCPRYHQGTGRGNPSLYRLADVEAWMASEGILKSPKPTPPESPEEGEPDPEFDEALAQADAEIEAAPFEPKRPRRRQSAKRKPKQKKDQDGAQAKRSERAVERAEAVDSFRGAAEKGRQAIGLGLRSFAVLLERAAARLGS